MATTTQHITWEQARYHPAYAAYQLLHGAFAVLPILAGLDKFFHVLTNWDMYLAPATAAILHVAPHSFMLLVGAIEIVAGIIVAIWPRVGAYIVALWLLAIIMNLLMLGAYFDIAVRDFFLGVSAVALARLSTEFEMHRTHLSE